jgi:predicted nucleic acid-binding protein
MAGKKCATLIDSGPLVALLDVRQATHAWAVDQLRLLSGPLMTCEAVLSETLFLLQHSPRAASQIQQWLKAGVLICWEGFSQSSPEVFSLMTIYENVPMSFADACLVRMSEAVPGVRVFTLDSDFRIYRRNKRQAIPLISPDDV